MQDQSHAPEQRLLAAYRATSYRVSAPGRDLMLRVDQYDAELAKLLREAWVECAALLTAWNPGSRPRSPEQNEAAQAALVQELTAAGCPCLPGKNLPDGGSGSATGWEEASVLALDLTLTAAREVAVRYGQIAFLWIDQQATPRLIATAADAPG